MQLKQLISDDDAVSPVIGVILMVAITVILAAVIATFVLGLGEQVSSTAPQASFAFEFSETGSSDGRLTITHDGGDSIKVEEVIVRGQNGSNAASSYTFNDNWKAIANANLGSGYGGSADGSISGKIGSASAAVAGDFLEIGVGTDGKLRVVYEAKKGDTSATLGIWEGPEAA